MYLKIIKFKIQGCSSNGEDKACHLCTDKTNYWKKAETVEDLLEKLLKEYGYTLKDELFDEKGKLKHTYRVVVNGRNINLLDGFKTKLKKDDMVVIMPAVAGG